MYAAEITLRVVWTSELLLLWPQFAHVRGFEDKKPQDNGVGVLKLEASGSHELATLPTVVGSIAVEHILIGSQVFDERCDHDGHRRGG